MITISSKILCFLVILITLFVNNTLSTTIIITPLQDSKLLIDLTQKATTKTTDKTDPHALIQLIQNYFGCYKYVNGICIKCNDNYFLNEDGKCSRVSENCRIFNLDQGICSQCLKGYFVVDGTCYNANSTNPLKNHCTILSDKQCIKCQKSYYLAKGICKSVDSQCRSWDSEGKCRICNNGYDLNSSNACIKTSNYKACQSKQYLSKELKCQKVPVNCQTWDSYNGKCVNCFNQFQLQQWQCSCSQKGYCQNQNCLEYNLQNNKQCQVCKGGFILEKNMCKQQKSLPKQCLKWNQNKTGCALCIQKWVINNLTEQCFKKVQNCTKYNIKGDCSQCISGYELIQLQCQLKAIQMNNSQIYGCEAWNFTSKRCDTCYLSFNNNKEGRCIYNEDHCLERNQRDYCTKCKEGYQVNAGNCQIKSQVSNQNKAGCKMFDWVNNQCLICEDDYTKSQNQTICKKPLNNCLKSNSSDCNSCSLNFELKNGKCEPFTTSKCIEKSFTGACARCADSFALVQGQCKTFKQLGTLLLDYTQFSPQKLREKIVVFTNQIKF